MFIFDNLMSLDDRGLQRLIRDVPNENLLTALKGVDAQVAERFFLNMSERAAAILREDLEASGPIKISDVEEAQKEIVKTAKRLSEEELTIEVAVTTSDLTFTSWHPRTLLNESAGNQPLPEELRQQARSEGYAQGHSEGLEAGKKESFERVNAKLEQTSDLD